jgi:hypothetical protein
MSDYMTNLSDAGWAILEPLLVRLDPRKATYLASATNTISV